ncbi:MAG TPA: hypothetical protein VIF57_11035 [Polyangia bacterium]|jgi:hypothetical protein
MRAAAMVVGAALLAGACVSSEVATIGPHRAARPEGCPVEIFPATTPPYPVVQVASARAKCHFTAGRNACLDELRKQACAAGADTVFAFQEGLWGEYTVIAATLAARSGERPARSAPAKQPAAGAAAEEGGCSPICSPGFACQAGACVPQCNPPCEAGTVCSRKRVCEPAGEKLEPAKATGTSL